MHTYRLATASLLMLAGCPEPQRVPPPTSQAADCIELPGGPLLLADVALTGSYDELSGVIPTAGVPLRNTCDVAVNAGILSLDIFSGPAVNPKSQRPVLGLRAGTALRIPAGTISEVVLDFDPAVQGTTEALLRLDLEGGGVQEVQVRAVAREARMRVVPPREGDHRIGCTDQVEVRIESTGEASLGLDEIALSAGDEPVVLVEAPELPLALPPGESVAVVLGFTPTEVGTSIVSLFVASDAWERDGPRQTSFPLELESDARDHPGDPCP